MVTQAQEKIQVEMSACDAQRFLEFQKNYETFNTLLDAGVFNVRNGTATLNFNNDGVLTEAKCQIVTYKRGFPVIHIIAPIA